MSDVPNDLSRGESSVDIRIVSKNPTDVETAAVTAVLTAALQELANDQAAGVVEATGWQRSQRAIRESRHPGTGAWRNR